MDKVFSAADFRPIMHQMFPDVEGGRIDNDGFEHPMTAVGVVLMSAAITGMTTAAKLILFTG